MWKYMIGLFIFCLVLFIYLHIQFHWKTSDNLEVYELENGSKEKLEEICDLRQPVIMNYYSNAILTSCRKLNILGNYHAFDLKVRNTKDDDYSNEIYVPLRANSTFKLFDDDKDGMYITENNQDFLQETSILKILQKEDEFIRPGLVSNCSYDFCMGSENSITPFRYEINYRNYFYVTSGEIEIKLASPKSYKYLRAMEDYDNFEFRSPINPWSPQEKYQYDFDKIKCMNILLPAGKMVHIPAYWWYSIRYKANANVVSFKYRTYMNTVAILPHIGMHVLQMQNVQHKIIKKYDLSQEKEKEKEKENGVTSIDELSALPPDDSLPILNPATNPVEELEIPDSIPVKIESI